MKCIWALPLSGFTQTPFSNSHLELSAGDLKGWLMVAQALSLEPSLFED